MPFVTIEWYEGRSGGQKAEIAERLTELLSEVGGTSPDQVWIRFVDSPRSDWAVGGAIQGVAGEKVGDGIQSAAGRALGPPD